MPPHTNSSSTPAQYAVSRLLRSVLVGIYIFRSLLTQDAPCQSKTRVALTYRVFAANTVLDVIQP